MLVGERQHRKMSGALDRDGQSPLVFCACSCFSPPFDFSAVGQEPAKHICLFVIDVVDLVDAKHTHFSPARELPAATAATASVSALSFTLLLPSTIGPLLPSRTSWRAIRGGGGPNWRPLAWLRGRWDRLSYVFLWFFQDVPPNNSHPTDAGMCLLINTHKKMTDDGLRDQ